MIIDYCSGADNEEVTGCEDCPDFGKCIMTMPDDYYTEEEECL